MNAFEVFLAFFFFALGGIFNWFAIYLFCLFSGRMDSYRNIFCSFRADKQQNN